MISQFRWCGSAPTDAPATHFARFKQSCARRTLAPSTNPPFEEIDMNNIKIRTIRAITISTAVALGIGAAGASAGTTDTVFETDGAINYVVRFPDLDLSKTEGVAALYHRLDHAARVVCAPLRRDSDQVNPPQYRACLAQAVDSAVAGINRPLLWQYHAAHTKGGIASSVQLAKAK
jgi:UrcA family protein